MVMFDTLIRNMLPPYGCTTVKAPNFDRLARHCVTFENSFAGSLPCMPARRELHTGRYNFLHRSWGPLEPFDDSMPEILKKNAVYTHLITDHKHYFENGGATYHTRYNTWEIVRGNQGDLWKASVEDPVMEPDLNTQMNFIRRQDWVNRTYMQGEENHCQKIAFNLGLEFLEKNHASDNWFLQLEVFDPHEPFFAPQAWRALYPDNYRGPRFDWPAYGRATESAAQIEHLRNEYRSLLSFCDYNLGRILDKMDAYDLWKDTMLIVNTDHGFLLGEHGWLGKSTPFYNEAARTPLFIWDPRQPQTEGQRRSSLVQTIDLAPSILDFFNKGIPPDMQGKPLQPVIREDTPVREAALFGVYGGHVNCTDGHYIYARAPVPANEPLYEYTLMPMHMHEVFSIKEIQNMELGGPFDFTKGCRLLKIPVPAAKTQGEFGTMLFDIKNDPMQEKQIEDAQIQTRMIGLMKKLMEENDAPEEQFIRLGLD